MRYWILERHNPQFKEPYYVLLGKCSAADAKKRENTLYGTNYVTSYQTEALYNERIQELKDIGAKIHL